MLKLTPLNYLTLTNWVFILLFLLTSVNFRISKISVLPSFYVSYKFSFFCDLVISYVKINFHVLVNLDFIYFRVFPQKKW